ncbi:uncharacterized protein LOC121835306 [Ixodes scapularis]|uniref:uncharacterized protein LOC121835306 n=1 Tax=Ixodes scapularis TaxID=6945 RepID=UPI001C38D114|nr:uncharacterized protein LOC121835306 [Ixodes scapularis]
MTTWPHFSVTVVTSGYTENSRVVNSNTSSSEQPAVQASPVTIVSPPLPSPPSAAKNTNLGIWFSNVRSLKNKLLDFHTLLLSYPDTVFAVCETWLNHSIPDGLLVDVESFTIFRKDRASNGGGLLVAIPCHMTCRKRQDLEHEHPEAVFVEVNHHQGKVLICCVYCPPTSQSTSYDLLGNSLRRAGMGNYLNTCVLGDFNAHIDWTDPSAPIPSAPCGDMLLDIMETGGFLQVCVEPSYISHFGKTSFLDLAFITNPALVSSCSLESSLPGSDHHAIYLESLLKPPKSDPHAKRIQQFSKTDGTHLQNLLHLVPWSLVTDEPCIHDAYDLWLDLFSAIEAECVPTRMTTGRQRPWITQDIIRLSRKKRQSFKKARRTKNPLHLSTAQQAQKSLKKLIYSAHCYSALYGVDCRESHPFPKAFLGPCKQ